MLRALKFVVASVLFLVNQLRGPKTIIEVQRPDNALGGLRGFTVRGFEIAIYCHRREYRVMYNRWYIRNRTLFAYHVFSVVGVGAPDALRKACELDVHLPPLLHRWNFDSVVRRQQVNAYLDLLEHRLAQENKNGISK